MSLGGGVGFRNDPLLFPVRRKARGASSVVVEREVSVFIAKHDRNRDTKKYKLGKQIRDTDSNGLATTLLGKLVVDSTVTLEVLRKLINRFLEDVPPRFRFLHTQDGTAAQIVPKKAENLHLDSVFQENVLLVDIEKPAVRTVEAVAPTSPLSRPLFYQHYDQDVKERYDDVMCRLEKKSGGKKRRLHGSRASDNHSFTVLPPIDSLNSRTRIGGHGGIGIGGRYSRESGAKQKYIKKKKRQ